MFSSSAFSGGTQAPLEFPQQFQFIPPVPACLPPFLCPSQSHVSCLLCPRHWGDRSDQRQPPGSLQSGDCSHKQNHRRGRGQFQPCVPSGVHLTLPSWPAEPDSRCPLPVPSSVCPCGMFCLVPVCLKPTRSFSRTQLEFRRSAPCSRPPFSARGARLSIARF